MANKGATRQSQRKKPWGQVVDEVDPNRRTEKTTAYQFSNARRFVHRRNPYT